jgi:splicing factor U2AF subunit
MASHLVCSSSLLVFTHDLLFSTLKANIFGTEQDRVNCSFYYKVCGFFAATVTLALKIALLLTQIGACRHGDRCSRKHIKPPFSQTILLPNVYHNPAHDPVCKLTEKDLQDGFDAIYEDLYCELTKFGHLLELHVRTRLLVLRIGH